VSSQGRSSGRRFDSERGVTTHAVLFLEDLDPETVGDAGAHATHYEAVPVDDFRQLIRALPMEAISSSTFVDAGAGMGRAVLLAMEYPFRQIVGVEISRALYTVATENLTKALVTNRRCADVRLICGDARAYSFPPGDIVLFLYNPFDGVALDRVLDRLARHGIHPLSYARAFRPFARARISCALLEPRHCSVRPAPGIKRCRGRRGRVARRCSTKFRRPRIP
jgi:hypothetical protein